MSSDDRVARIGGDELPPEASRALDEKLAGLARDLPPPAATWQAVEARLSPRRAPVAHWRSFALAASVATLAVLLGLTAIERPAGTGSVASGPAGATVTPDPTSARIDPDALRTAELPPSLGGREALGPGFLRVRAQVSTDFQTRLEQLDPVTRQVVETNLDVIHAALGRIEAALDADPDNTLLQELLVSTWRQELDYMGHVNRMPEPLDRRMEL